MKKCTVFCLFLLTLSFSVMFFSNNAFAELQGYTLNISAQVANDSSGQYSDTDKYNVATNTFTADYSYFIDTASVNFVGTTSSTGENLGGTLFTYEWKNSAGTILNNSANLVLYKTATTASQPLLLIGETKYVLTVTNTADGSSDQVVITVKITDANNTCDIHTYSPIIPAEVNNTSSNLNFTAKLPIVNGSSINWYLKTPNSSAYNIVKSNSETYDFTPATTINNQNGYGTYSIMAIGYNKNTKNYYYSEVFNINGLETTKNIVSADYNISVKVVDNTKANVEAFEYTLSNSSNLNASYIIWYVNNLRVSSGNSFIYEPTDTEAYKVTAKYQKTDGTITELATHRQEPNATGTEQLIFYILGAVAVLSVIFAISIIITNKKRDVVW